MLTESLPYGADIKQISSGNTNHNIFGDFCRRNVNPLSPRSDQHQISPCNINAL